MFLQAVTSHEIDEAADYLVVFLRLEFIYFQLEFSYKDFIMIIKIECICFYYYYLKTLSGERPPRNVKSRHYSPGRHWTWEKELFESQ